MRSTDGVINSSRQIRRETRQERTDIETTAGKSPTNLGNGIRRFPRASLNPSKPQLFGTATEHRKLNFALGQTLGARLAGKNTSAKEGYSGFDGRSRLFRLDPCRAISFRSCAVSRVSFTLLSTSWPNCIRRKRGIVAGCDRATKVKALAQHESQLLTGLCFSLGLNPFRERRCAEFAGHSH